MYVYTTLASKRNPLTQISLLKHITWLRQGSHLSFLAAYICMYAYKEIYTNMYVHNDFPRAVRQHAFAFVYTEHEHFVYITTYSYT